MEIWLRQWKKFPFWRVNTAMWAVFALLFFLRTSLHLEPANAAMLTAFQLALCLSLVAALEWFYVRQDQALRFNIWTAVLVVTASFVATIVQSTAAHLLTSAKGWSDPTWSLLEMWLLRVMFFWLVYMAWSLLFFWLRAERMAQTSEQKALEARAATERVELHLLRSQLDPHFLFNALNGISSASAAGAPKASAMAKELADYLRYSLDHRHDTKVPLQREIQAMRAYLKIEEARFGSDLHVDVAIGPGSGDREIPCFLLLPLVENSVKHSLRTSQPPWEIHIQTSVHDARLCIEIQNPGSLHSKKEGGGVGLEILRRRLEIHYPGCHRLDLKEENGMVRAMLELEGVPCSA